MNEQAIVNLSLIIPTCNRSDDVLSTIRSYLSAPTIPSEIIIVDQSDNQERNYLIKGISHLKEHANRCVLKIIKLDVKSLTKARNIGLVEASNNIIVFSDDDVLVCGDTIGETYKLMNDSQYAMCGGLDKNTKYFKNKLVTLLSCFIGRKEWNQRYIGCVTKSVYGTYPYIKIQSEVETRWAMGFYFAIKKDLADNWNVWFDEKLSAYAYAEDLDFTYRYWINAKKIEKKCVISNKIMVYHLGSLVNRLPTKTMFLKECINRLYLSYKLFNDSKSHMFCYHWANVWTGVRLLIRKPKIFRLWASACKKARKNKDMIRKGIVTDEMYD